MFIEGSIYLSIVILFKQMSYTEIHYFLFLCSIQPVRFPVKMTSPPTAILYIAEDFEYMTQLKDTLHVKEVEIGKNKF